MLQLVETTYDKVMAGPRWLVNSYKDRIKYKPKGHSGAYIALLHTCYLPTAPMSYVVSKLLMKTAFRYPKLFNYFLTKKPGWIYSLGLKITSETIGFSLALTMVATILSIGLNGVERNTEKALLLAAMIGGDLASFQRALRSIAKLTGLRRNREVAITQEQFEGYDRLTKLICLANLYMRVYMTQRIPSAIMACVAYLLSYSHNKTVSYLGASASALLILGDFALDFGYVIHQNSGIEFRYQKILRQLGERAREDSERARQEISVNAGNSVGKLSSEPNTPRSTPVSMRSSSSSSSSLSTLPSSRSSPSAPKSTPSLLRSSSSASGMSSNASITFTLNSSDSGGESDDELLPHISIDNLETKDRIETARRLIAISRQDWEQNNPMMADTLLNIDQDKMLSLLKYFTRNTNTVVHDPIYLYDAKEVWLERFVINAHDNYFPIIINIDNDGNCHWGALYVPARGSCRQITYYDPFFMSEISKSVLIKLLQQYKVDRPCVYYESSNFGIYSASCVIEFLRFLLHADASLDDFQHILEAKTLSLLSQDYRFDLPVFNTEDDGSDDGSSMRSNPSMI